MMIGSDELEQFVCCSNKAVEFKFGMFMATIVNTVNVKTRLEYSLEYYHTNSVVSILKWYI